MELKDKLESYVGTDGTLQIMDDILSAANTYLTNPEDVETVAMYLEKIQNETTLENTSETFQSVYNTLLAAIGPSVAVKYYDDGLDAYQKEMYDDAISNLEKARIYDSANIDVLYNLANAYYKNGDLENAGIHYQMVVDGFSGTERARKSERYLKEIEGNQ